MGFLFPATGLRLTRPESMKENTEADVALDPEPDERRAVTILSGIYLDAGLPLEFAVRSAIADYDLFTEPELCRP